MPREIEALNIPLPDGLTPKNFMNWHGLTPDGGAIVQVLNSGL